MAVTGIWHCPAEIMQHADQYTRGSLKSFYNTPKVLFALI